MKLMTWGILIVFFFQLWVWSLVEKGGRGDGSRIQPDPRGLLEIG